MNNKMNYLEYILYFLSSDKIIKWKKTKIRITCMKQSYHITLYLIGIKAFLYYKVAFDKKSKFTLVDM